MMYNDVRIYRSHEQHSWIRPIKSTAMRAEEKTGSEAMVKGQMSSREEMSPKCGVRKSIFQKRKGRTRPPEFPKTNQLA